MDDIITDFIAWVVHQQMEEKQKLWAAHMVPDESQILKLPRSADNKAFMAARMPKR